SIIDSKGERSAHARDDEPILSRRAKPTEISFIYCLIRCWTVSVAHVSPLDQAALIDLRAGGGIHQLKSPGDGNVHFAQTSRVITYHRFFRIVGHIPFLVHMDGRAVAQWIRSGGKRHTRGPK